MANVRGGRGAIGVVIAVLAASVVVSAQASRIPSPESVIGFAPGAESKLATYDQTIDYFRKLDAASDRMTLVEAGTSTQGRTFYFALISSPANLKKIDRYREIARQLSRPGGPDRGAGAGAGARRQADRPHRRRPAFDRSRRPAAHAAAGLRPADSQPRDPQIARILDNVILMLWPTINPDGHQMVADWYMKNAGTPNETLPRLYQEYVGHDNNRDAYMLNMIESRVIEHTWRQWEPQIIYVQHQSSPFPTRIWLPPFAEPIATHAPYLMSRAGQHHRHGDRAGTRRARPGRRHPHGHRLRRVVRRLHRLRADVQERRGVLDRDRAGRHGLVARVQDRRVSRRTTATCGRRRSTRARGRRGRGRCATRSSTWRRRRCRCSTTRRGSRRTC